MKKWKKRFCLVTAIVLAVASITSFAENKSAGQAQDAAETALTDALQEESSTGDPELPFWAEDSLTTMSIKNYVADVTDESSENFIPVRDRIAVFDFDGTLFGELYPTYFDTTMFVHRVLHDDSFDAPEDLKKIASEMEEGMKSRKMPEGSEEILATSVPKAYKGMTVSEYEDYIREFMTFPADGFEGMCYGDGFYLPMMSLVKYLADNDFEVWVCSGTDRICARTLVDHALGWWVPPSRVIGTNHTIVAAEQDGADPLKYVYKSDDDVVMGGELIVKNLKMNKVSAIVQEIGKVPVLAFGNSTGDLSMAQYTVNNSRYPGAAYLLLCDDTERDYGNPKKALSLQETCIKSGFHTVSMKHDFTTIYGEDVVKTDHTDNYTWMRQAGEDLISASDEAAVYESADGWKVKYDPSRMTAETLENGARFAYAGEGDAEGSVTILFTEDKQPEELLAEMTESWGDPEEIQRTEGFFPGTEDKWSYWRIFNDKDTIGNAKAAIAGEYNGGVLSFEVDATMSGDDGTDAQVSDLLSGVIDSVSYEEFGPQTMYDYIPGRYVMEETEEIEGEELSYEYSVTLNEDHTGTVSMQDDIEVLWGDYLLTDQADFHHTLEYDIEGDHLMLKADDTWLEFVKVPEEEAAPAEAVAAEDAALPEESPEWVTELDQAKDAQQLFIVAGIGETTANVTLHEKDDNGVWRQIMTTPGYIGKRGLGKEKEGDAKTPVGTFGFNYAFGIAEDPGCALTYHQVDDDSYWSGDQREGYHYNEMVSIADLPDLNTGDSEHIADYTNEYQYCLNISYNAEGTPGLGSAIFLHCLGAVKPYTGGCVAIPKDKMVTVMQNVSEDCVVVIDSLKVLSPATWNQMGLLPEAEE